MKSRRIGSAPPTARGVYARLSQQLKTFVERERSAGQAKWTNREDAKLTQARRALFGSAPK